jgi:hypothetical protein
MFKSNGLFPKCDRAKAKTRQNHNPDGLFKKSLCYFSFSIHLPMSPLAPRLVALSPLSLSPFLLVAPRPSPCLLVSPLLVPLSPCPLVLQPQRLHSLLKNHIFRDIRFFQLIKTSL